MTGGLHFIIFDRLNVDKTDKWAVVEELSCCGVIFHLLLQEVALSHDEGACDLTNVNGWIGTVNQWKKNIHHSL